MGTLRVGRFKYLKFNVVNKTDTFALRSFCILYYFTMFEAVLKRFQRVSAGVSVPLLFFFSSEKPPPALTR